LFSGVAIGLVLHASVENIRGWRGFKIESYIGRAGQVGFKFIQRLGGFVHSQTTSFWAKKTYYITKYARTTVNKFVHEFFHRFVPVFFIRYWGTYSSWT